MPCPEELEEVAVVQVSTVTTDGAGGYSESWATRKTIFCKVANAGGGEALIAGRLEHTESFILTTHYDTSILKTDRILLDGTTYKITSIQNLDRKSEYMTINIETGRT